MKNWIGVVSSNAVLEAILSGEHKWFCLDGKVQVGDRFFLFATSKLTKANGIFGHFEVVTVDPDRKDECRMFGGSGSSFAAATVYVEFKRIKLFKKTVSFQDLKNDDTTKFCSGVTRNFRGTCFSISKASYAAILNMAS